MTPRLEIRVFWMLQGQELQALRAATPYQRIVYCGDGANDLCPALALAPGDVVLARKVCTCHMHLSPYICSRRHVVHDAIGCGSALAVCCGGQTACLHQPPPCCHC